ncbi:signal peptidase I [Desulfovibrio litoralis]|nr:signal peptidase I [Desulfovibrio litoralis]
MNKRLTTALVAFVVVFVLAQLFNYYIIRLYQVHSNEMQLSVLDGDYVLVNQVVYRNQPSMLDSFYDLFGTKQEIRNGDIVLVAFNDKTDRKFTKLKLLRVIGVPGDQIKIDNKKVFRNSEALLETYVSHSAAEEFLPLRDEMEEVIVPEKQYFLLADNRDIGQDSRVFGFVPRENIIGKASSVLFSYDNGYGSFRNKRTFFELK